MPYKSIDEFKMKMVNRIQILDLLLDLASGGKAMDKLEKNIVKKEQEIEKLKQKMKEQEEKQKRDQSRLKEEVKELENRVKELLKEKADIVLSEEQAVHEKEAILKQLTGLQEENKRLQADLAQVGVLKAEITGLKLRIENQGTGMSEMEQMLLTKDDIIDQLRTSESKLREEIRSKNDEIAKRESVISMMKSGKLNIEQSLEQSQDKIKNLESEITTLKNTIVNKDAKITHLNTQIETLEKEKLALSETVQAKDTEISELSGEISSLITRSDEVEKKAKTLEKGIEQAEAGLISDALPNLVKGESQAVDRITEILNRIKHNAIMAVPKFELLPQLIDLENWKTSSRLRIITNVDFENPSHKAVFKEIQRPNIAIRHTDEKNLWGINRDHEELLMAPQDSTGTPIGIIMRDPFQIEILGNILLDIWGKCRKNVDEYSFS